MLSLRNKESFFWYYEVIKYVWGWSNPIKPEGHYDWFDHAHPYDCRFINKCEELISA